MISHILIPVYMFGLFVGNVLVVFICFKDLLYCWCKVALMCSKLIFCFCFVHLENMSLSLKYTNFDMSLWYILIQLSLSKFYYQILSFSVCGINEWASLKLQCRWIKIDLVLLHKIILSKRNLSIFYDHCLLQGSKKT